MPARRRSLHPRRNGRRNDRCTGRRTGLRTARRTGLRTRLSARGVAALTLSLAALWLPAALLLALPAALGACSAASPGTPAVQRLARYEGLLQRPLAERVLPADDAVLDRAQRTNLDYGEDVRPRAADPQSPLAPVVRQVLGDLPAPVARLAERHLAAVYLVEGDVGTATTEGVQDAQGHWRHAYIVLNLTALQRDANAWATWKEGSAFHPSPGYALRMTIAPPQGDDRAGAVRFILLHELGHVLGLGLQVHPYWDDPPPPPGLVRGLSPYVSLSWQLQPGRAGEPTRIVSRYAGRLPRLKLAFYKFEQAPTALAEAPAVYADLAQTDFPSLYGSTGLYDDFAEAFAIYVHSVLLGRPYRVEVLRDGAAVAEYRSCIATGACPRKIAEVEALLRQAPSGVQVHMGMGAGIGVRPR
jgi:hypothetical protein